MNRIKCTVSYDGSCYYGWQAQNGLPCIEAEIEKALKVIHKSHIDIFASGRTDAKVHAIGQVFHFDSPLEIPEEKWRQAINGLVPDSIYLTKVEKVDESFHSRHSCAGKVYEYRFSCGSFDVHRAKYCTQIRGQLDIEAMREACSVFIGTHDFTSFNANDLEERPYQVRTIHSMDIIEDGKEWVIRVDGNGFLRYMVRMMVGCLFEIGKGRLDIGTLQDWMERKDKTCCRHNAPPQGLYLKEVYYE